jgi:hypothetical protein
MLFAASGELKFKKSVLANYYPTYSKIKDTLFTLTNNYIEINLNEQRAKLHQKNDSTLEFKISSGNSKISKGIETPTGIFTVQNKSPLATSKQFNDAKLFNWIGFNGNIGFHGLEGKSYYNTLGKRASSHGCVRISIEDGKTLYSKVKTGTPVIVVDKEPARIISFIDSNEFYLPNNIFIDNFLKPNRKLLNRRLDNLYSGLAFRENYERIVINVSYILRNWIIDVGDFSKVPEKQKEPLLGSFLKFKSDNATSNIKSKKLLFKDSTKMVQ